MRISTAFIAFIFATIAVGSAMAAAPAPVQPYAPSSSAPGYSIGVPYVAPSAGISDLLLKAVPGLLYEVDLSTSVGVSGQLILVDSATLSGSGGSLTGTVVAKCLQASLNLPDIWTFNPPLKFINGIAAYFSSANSCTTLTPQNALSIGGQVP